MGYRERDVLEVMLPRALDDEVAARVERRHSVCHETFQMDETRNRNKRVVATAMGRLLERHSEQSDTRHIQGEAADHRGPEAEAREHKDDKEHVLRLFNFRNRGSAF